MRAFRFSAESGTFSIQVSELDQKLIDALYFHQFDEAERLIARGADINAYSRSDDDIDWDESLLSEALYCDSEKLSVATFALKHGLETVINFVSMG